MAEVRERLFLSIEELKLSVMSAYEQFLVKYGSGHAYISRLESYFPIIEKQKQLLASFDETLKSNDTQGMLTITAKLTGLSDMVKEDARSLLYSINNGDAHTHQDTDVH